ncbi:urease accessory protein UreE [Rhizobiaceae bacterium]|nr:urease accessory protein UreE [Rhizobiaceae bacterium]
MHHARTHLSADDAAGAGQPVDHVIIDHGDRHLRRKRLTLASGVSLAVDLATTVRLREGDRLVLDDGGTVEIRAAEEALLRVAANSPAALSRLAWHIGNRHLAAQIEADHILLAAERTVEAMLRGLGAKVEMVTGTFEPEAGAYEHGHHREHAHG